ncbi:hypothetical protein G4B88_018745 [Cannabis sativa]|nr:hypothetical protein G4B88_018745 [Cannabis sativa]
METKIDEGDFLSRRKLKFKDNDKYVETRVESEKNVNITRTNILDEVIPKVSMEFETEEEAYNFSNTYAYNVGTRANDKQNVNVKRHRAETRFGCLAKMKINCRQIGKYKVVESIAEHNHVTLSPIKSHLHRSKRTLTPAQAVEIDLVESSGIAPKASLDLMVRRTDGSQNLGFILDDC